MADSKRLPSSSPDEAAVRDGQIDALLDEGLDRYFAGRYEDAIHLWTRVLFLDRSHARARAYIERARTALSEMQRRSDELLQASRDLLEQGETEAARRLLAEAVAGSGDDVQASTLLVRLERIERVRALTGTLETGLPAAAPTRGRGWIPSPRMALALGLPVLVIAGVIAALGSGWLTQDSTDPARVATKAGAAVAAEPVRLPVLSSSEVALVRARTSVAHGRLSDALVALDRVATDSPERPAADQLRIDIQQLLMASARNLSSTTLTEHIRR
jgi:tetratricopeptide (TPR) repeat protein